MNTRMYTLQLVVADIVNWSLIVLYVCRTVGKRVASAMCWVGVSAVVCALVLGILYGEFSLHLSLSFSTMKLDSYIIMVLLA